MNEDRVAEDRDLALYVHWPFCLSKCPYCDFNSHVRDSIDQARYGRALRRDLAWEASRLGHRRVTSIYFGGGTPSLMAPSTVSDLLDDAARDFELADTIEITLEANPTSVEAGRMAGYRAAGVNRVSLGVQSLVPDDLRFLGRRHSVSEALSAFETARRLFPRVSFDLIYGLPGQDIAAWRTQLRTALAMAADHLSLYQLTIEPGTAFHHLHAQGRLALPDDPLAVALYDATEEECSAFGFVSYEISNYAVPGQESRHNLSYWHYLDYAGIGPGAHGRITANGTLLATQRHKVPERWMGDVESGVEAGVSEPVSPVEMGEEALLMGLRLREGIDLSRLERRTGRGLESIVEIAILKRCIEEGYLTLSSERLTATADGRMKLNAILGQLLG